MQGRLLPKLFSQMVQSLQTTDFYEQPLLVTLLHLLQTLPGIGNVLQKGMPGRIYFQLCRVLESQGRLPHIHVLREMEQYILKPFCPQRAWRQACCWASAWSVGCWSLSPADTSPELWVAYAHDDNPWNPLASVAWHAWSARPRGSPTRGWSFGSTPEAEEKNLSVFKWDEEETLGRPKTQQDYQAHVKRN